MLNPPINLQDIFWWDFCWRHPHLHSFSPTGLDHTMDKSPNNQVVLYATQNDQHQQVFVRSFDDDDDGGDDAGVDGVDDDDALEPDQVALSICKVDKCSDPPCIGRSFLVDPSPCQTVIMMIITGF